MRLISWLRKQLDGTSKEEAVSTDNPLPVAGNLSAPALGESTAPAAAANGTGDITIIGALRRGLINWATLLTRLPALVGGLMPVEPNISRGAGNVDATTTRVTLATDGPTVTAIGATDSAAAAADGTGSVTIIGALRRGLINWTTLLGRVPALVGGRMPVNSSIPTAATGAILSMPTSSTGSQFVPFDNAPCSWIDIVNNTDVVIEYQRGTTGATMPIQPGAARMVIAITNANQIRVRRTDQSNTPVTVHAEAFTA